MLRDWTDSDKMSLVSVHAERFFIRLIMKVDDFGCFYADTRLLKANLFPLLLDTIREADLLRWMAECQKAGLIVLYENAGKKYIQILAFKQRLDKAKSKFPLPIENQPVNDSMSVVLEFPSEQNRTRTEVEVEVEIGEPPKHTPDEIILFKNFQEFIKRDAINVSKMKEPFTIDEYLKIKIQYSSAQVKELLLKMGNYKPLLSKNISAYRTFLNWMERSYESEPKNEITNGISINDRLKAATQNRA